MLSRLNVNDQPRIESLGNVTTLLGQRGDLKCRVRNRFNNTVRNNQALIELIEHCHYRLDALLYR